MRHTTPVLSCLVLLSLTLVGCADDPTPAPPSLACQLNSDCPVGRTCDRGLCVALSTCEEGEECPCADDLQCPVGQICNAFTRTCVDTECDEALDCALGQVCVSNRCLTDTAADRDRDGVPDAVDLCPSLADPEQEDLDGDGIGDACDRDDDSDGVLDPDDRCPRVPDPSQLDHDGDGLGNACDPDWQGVAVSGELTSPLRSPDWDAATLRLTGADGPHTPPAIRDGLFLLEGLDPGIYALDATLPGHLPLSRAVQIPADTDTLDLGELPLLPESEAATLSGRARLGDVGAEGDHGQIIVQARAADSLVASTLTAPDGSFVVAVPRTDLELALSRPGYERLTADTAWDDDGAIFRAGPEDTPVADYDGFVLSPAATATLTGRIESPLAGIDDWSSRAVVTLLGEQTQRIEPVLADGSFQFSGLRPGAWTLLVDARGHLPWLAPAFDLLPGDNTLPTITLTPELLDVRGLVQLVGPDGPEPTHANVVVRARRATGFVDSTITEADGSFTLQLTPEDHTLSLSLTHFTPVDTDIRWVGDRFVLPDASDAPLADTPLVLERLPTSDRDADGVIDHLDNCPEIFNTDQANTDREREDTLRGDACDPDIDEDGIANSIDNCPRSFNPMQEDPDGDGLGIACADGPEGPLALLCGITHQWIDSTGRPDLRAGSCGGAGAPEVTYQVYLEAGDSVDVHIGATFGTAIYLVESGTRIERGCSLSSMASLTATRTGPHLVVIDGSGPGARGPLVVDLQKRSCRVEPGGTLEFPTAPLPQDIVLADFDADGAFDMGVVSFQSSEVAILRGLADGTFAPARRFGMDGLGSAIAAGDLDGDGVLDLVTSNVRPDGINVLRGLGDATFATAERIPTDGYPVDVTLVDLDEDGVLDLVTANQAGRSISVRLGHGDGTFGPVRYLPTGGVALDAIASDLDNDGLNDLVVVNSDVRDTGESSLAILLGLGDGTFEPPRLTPTAPYSLEASIGDVDGDGNVDVVGAIAFADVISIHRGLGDGALAPVELLPFDVPRPQDVTLVDVDDDGWLDIAAVAGGDYSVRVLRNTGSGVFEEGVYLRAGEEPVAIDSADLNIDGLEDLVVANYGSDDATVLLASGQGDYQSTWRLFVGGGFPLAIVVDDFDGDGLADLAVANRGKSLDPATDTDSCAPYPVCQEVFDNAVVVRYGTPDGFDRRGFVPGTILGGPFTRVSPGVAQPQAMAGADLNGDARPDLIVVNATSNAATVLLAGPDRTLTPAPSLPIGRGSYGVAIADLDGDTDQDVVVASASNEVVFFEGHGDGTFTEVGRGSTAAGPGRIELADIDGDGGLDVVVLTTSDNGVDTLRSTQTPFVFTAAAHHAVGNTPSRLAVIDVDRDGSLDIVTSNVGSGDLSILTGRGDGRFEPESRFPVGLRPLGLVVDDIDQDGIIDIATGNNGSGTVSLLRGTGDGTFERENRIPVGGHPLDLRFADVDDDGVRELLVSTSSGDVTILRVEVSQRIQSDQRVTVGSLPTAVAAGDLDGDGVAEIVVTEDGALTVYASTPPWDARLTRSTAVRASRLTMADLNGDGLDDVLFLLPSANALAVALATGDQTLLAPLSLHDVGQAPVDLAVGDADLDGELDVVVLNRESGDVSWLRGRGDGMLTPEQRLPTGSGTFTYGYLQRGATIELSDITGDGQPEIVVAHSNVAIEWVEFDANGGLVCTTSVPFDCALPLNARAPADLISVDIDSNGYQDLVFVSFTTHDLVVLLNSGGALFGRPLIHTLSGTPTAVVASDATGDGWLDLLVTISSTNALDLFASRGNGLFDAVRSVPTGSEPRGLAVVDLDGNGNPEALTANRADDTVSVLSFRRAELNREGTRWVDAPLPPCPYDPAQDSGVFVSSTEANDQVFDLGAGQTCRISRLDIEIMGALIPSGTRLFLEAVDLELPVVPLVATGEQTWRPEDVPALARFEGSPARGRWRLRREDGLSIAGTNILHVNRFPDDPISASRSCAAEVRPDLPCVLDTSPVAVNGLAGETWWLLLPDEGGAGGLLAGETLEVDLTGAPEFDVELLAYGARLPVVAVSTTGGPTTLEWEVPPAYAGRRLVLRVRPRSPGMWSVTDVRTGAR